MASISPRELKKPIYTLSRDQEPIDLNKKLQVRLFKRSENRREAEWKIDQKSRRASILWSEFNLEPPSAESKARRQAKKLIKELLVRQVDGKTTFEPKNKLNCLRFLHAANHEIDIIERETKRLSQVEKNRIFLKFVDMNDSPHKYKHYEHFKDGKQTKVELNLRKSELAKLYSKTKRTTRNDDTHQSSLANTLLQGSIESGGDELSLLNMDL